MKFSRKVLIGLAAGIATGLFFGELVAPLTVMADGFIRLLQMTVLPYVTLSIVANIGKLTYVQARTVGLRTVAVMGVIWVASIVIAYLSPLAFPDVERAAFFSPAIIERPEPFNFVELFVPSNPFEALAATVVPAVVLFSVLTGLALIGVENKQPLLTVLDGAIAAVGRVARFVVRLTPYGLFAIAAVAAGTLDIEQLQRIEVYLATYVALSLVLSLWVLPQLVALMTPIGPRELLSTARDGLITAFVVGDLFVVLPFLMEACTTLIDKRIDDSGAAGQLPSSIVPLSFTLPNAGKLLSLSFVLFAGWYSDTLIPLVGYPELAIFGFLSSFGSLNVAIPFLLDLFRVPSDTFQLFVATSVVNARFATLLAAVNTLAVGILGSAAIAGRLRIEPARLLRFAVTTSIITVGTVVGLRVALMALVNVHVDSRAIVYSMAPLAFPPVDDRLIKTPDAVPASAIPPADQILRSVRSRGTLRVGLMGDGIPYQFRNGRDQVVGFDIEMAQNLAADLGVGIEWVRFAASELDKQVLARTVDIVMSGARLTPNRAAVFNVSEPYFDETLAVIVADHARADFQSWAAIRDMGPVRLGMQNLQYYIGRVRRLLPEAEITVIEDSTGLIDEAAPYAAYVLPAERGSVLTMLNPRFSVVVPDGESIKMPLAYPVAGNDQAWVRYVNTWIQLKKRDGFIDALYQQWILGRAATRDKTRWSILRDVLGW